MSANHRLQEALSTFHGQFALAVQGVVDVTPFKSIWQQYTY